MSKPKINYKDVLAGAAMQITSAMSSLNMLPEPVPAPPGSNEYLSETDANAAHAMEHLTAAAQLVERAREELEPYLAEKRIRELIAEHAEEVPAFKPRRPLNDDEPDGYEESDRDWFEQNRFLILWLLERYEEAIKRAGK
jgi:hypothetical protein